MGEIEMDRGKSGSPLPLVGELVTWADWWEDWGNEIFDAPATLRDIEFFPS